MQRRSRKVASSALALLIFSAMAWPGSAAAAPNPRPDEWWFKAWGVQSHLWPLSTGEGVTVALLDTGVQAGLPDLEGVVIPGMDAEGGSGDGREDLDQFGDPPGHGTGMASLIAGQGRGTGMVGVAPGAKILPVVAQSTPAYAKGIRFAVDHGAQVINLSQAVVGFCPEDLQESIAYALSKDAVVIAGAGNDGNGGNASNSPANCKGVLPVGAVDLKGRPWEKTQRQPYVMVAAPGVDTRLILKDGKIYRGNGTSAATALVSGAVAIIRAEHPEMKNREVVRQLIASAADVYEKGKDDRTGYGMIRPYRPLVGKAPKGTANPVFEEFDRWMKTHHPEPGKAAPKASEDDDFSSIIIFFASAFGLGLVGCVLAFILRKRSGALTPAGPGGGPQGGPSVPPQGWGGQAVPPQGGHPSRPPQGPGNSQPPS